MDDTIISTTTQCQLNHNNSYHNFFDSFCDYDLLLIMRYFTVIERIGLSRVCRRWQALIDESFKTIHALNQCTVMASDRTNISKLAMNAIIRKCYNVKRIDFKGIKIIGEEKKCDDNSVVLTIAEHCSQLQQINFDVRDVIEEEFEVMAKSCKKLKNISSKKINDKSLQHVIESPVLECIDLSHNSNITGEQFDRFGPNICEINFFRGFSLRTVDNAIRKLIAGNGKRIKKLSIYNIDDNILSLICDNFAHLTHLKFRFISQLSNIKKVSNLLNLTNLSIDAWNDSAFNGKHLKQLVKSLRNRNIRELEMSVLFNSNRDLNDESLALLCECCPKLEKLVLRRFKHITDSGMQSIAKLINLKHLDLMSCSDIGNGVDIVIKQCNGLRVLNVHNCSLIENHVLYAFIAKCKAMPSELFALDVIDTSVDLIDRKLPSNLKFTVNSDQCIYGCRHKFANLIKTVSNAAYNEL